MVVSLGSLEAELQEHIPISFEMVPSNEALAMLKSNDGDGRSHFLVGPNADVFDLFQQSNFKGATTGEHLASAAKTSGGKWLKNEFETGMRYAFDLPREPSAPAESVYFSGLNVQAHWYVNDFKAVPLSDVKVGDWPADVEPNDSIGAIEDISTRTVHPEVVVAALETNDWTELPAFVGYGGWNANPDPHIHVAVWRYWRRRYGIRLVSMRFDRLEFSVSRPPRNKSAALELAREHHAYCDDIITQGVGSLSNLAAILMVSPYWHFWWD